MLLKLTYMDGETKRLSITLPGDFDPLIGRDESANHIVIHQANVSRLHARILGYQGRYVIRDMNSTKGTFVNGERVNDEHKIVNGDRLRFAAEEMLFELVDWAGEEDDEYTVRVTIPENVRRKKP